MKPTSHGQRTHHLSLVGSQVPAESRREAMDFSQLAKFAADVLALNAQGVCGVTPPDGHKKEFKPATLASFKSGLIVKKPSDETERSCVVPFRPALKE